MAKITFEIFTHQGFINNIHVFDINRKDKHTKEYLYNMVKKTYKKWFDEKSYCFKPGIGDNELELREIKKPKTFPKFSNEIKFNISFDGKKIINPEILAIRWINEWQYKLKHIGHEYDYQSETKMTKI